ncbi:MAG: hypothetical protein ACOX3G_08475 [Armatimonadota bacterium]|jgi:tetratricopeptide (TPR) repeat protein
MGAYTYTDPRVSRFINQHLVPVQFNVKEDTGAPVRYHTQWTPTSMYFDVEDREFRRSYGALNADQFLAEYSLAHALRYFHTGQFEKSVVLFKQALEYTKTDPERHAENLYWIGPALYEYTGNLDELISGFKTLQEAYPDSDWTKKSHQLKAD